MAVASPQPAWLRLFSDYRSMIVPLGFVGLLMVVIVPMPPMVMDVLLAANLAIAALILLTTIFVKSPLDFSVFPSVLLGTTLIRLVLNIATTRLILAADAPDPESAKAAAGGVIETFASVVTSGSVVVGVVLFVILIIVQFVVITKGATRISEVAARFTLDAMPGKQMAIDADLNAGLIDEAAARTRRERIAQEADFYGAMDGAAKFVRGDAVAGILITLINILGGFAIGVFLKGWSLAESIETFTILTIGDGLVSQLPAFVISVAAGLIVTRSSGRADLGSEVAGQLTGQAAALVITAVFLVFMVFTGMPPIPMLGLAAGLGAMAWFGSRRKGREEVQARERLQEEAQEKQHAKEETPVEAALHVDTLELEVGYALVRMVDAAQGGDLLERISLTRRQLAGELGLVMPPVRVRDNMQLGPNDYRIKIRGNTLAQGQVYPGQLLAMDGGLADAEAANLQGLKTREPAFGLPAVWIEEGQRQRAESLNYTVVDASSVLATHLTEVVRHHADELLTREETGNLVTQLKERAPKLVAEVLEGDNAPVKPGELQKVLQNLLRERVPVRDLETILETLGDWAPRTKDCDVLTEYVRNGLRRAICHQYAVVEPADEDAGLNGDPMREVSRLYCVSLDPGLEETISGYIQRSNEGTTTAMPPAVANRVTAAIVAELQRLVEAGRSPVVLASPGVRATVHRLLEPHLPQAAVLGYNEVSRGVEVESLGLVTLDEPPTPPRRVRAAGDVNPPTREPVVTAATADSSDRWR